MASSDDPVGYGKPPKKNQFKKGRSGNPSGRPKGTTHFPWLVLAAMDRAVTVRKGDTRKTMRMQKAMAEALAIAAAAGDPKARAEVLRFEDEHRGGYEAAKADSALNAKNENALIDEIFSFYPPELVDVVLIHYRLRKFIRKNLAKLRQLRAQEQGECGNET